MWEESKEDLVKAPHLGHFFFTFSLGVLGGVVCIGHAFIKCVVEPWKLTSVSLPPLLLSKAAADLAGKGRLGVTAGFPGAWVVPPHLGWIE